MKTTLQYAYSITVLVGVLVTAYFMMNNEGNARIPLAALPAPSFRVEAIADPAVNQLFQVEGALSEIRIQAEKDAKRLPSEAQK